MAQRKHRRRKAKITRTATTKIAIPEEEEENKHNIPTIDRSSAEDDQAENIPIPTDSLTEIFSLLPVSCLLSLTPVCKSWLQLISSPLFIQNRLNKSKERVSRILISTKSAIMDYDAIEGPRKKQIPYPPGFYSPKIMGSCDGLICLFDEKNNSFSVFNPSTGKSFMPVLVDGFDCGEIMYSWFGHHPHTAEYVLVIGKLDWRGTKIRVYKLKSSDSCPILHQREIENYWCWCLEEIGTLLRGTLYWSAKYYYSRVILAYDFKTGEVFEIAAPRYCPQHYCPFTLGVKDGCLLAVCKYEKVFELWMMKESWTKCADIIEGFGDCRRLVPLGFSSDGEMVLDADDSMLIKYGFGDKKGTILKTRHKFRNSKAIACTESLVRPELVCD